MAQNPPTSSAGAVVVDANILISICAKEQATYVMTKAAFEYYATRGWAFYAPGVIVSEVLYTLCGKLQGGILTRTEHSEAVEFFRNYMSVIFPPPSGDASVIAR